MKTIHLSDNRTIRKFAWLPTKLTEGWVWLKPYEAIQEFHRNEQTWIPTADDFGSYFPIPIYLERWVTTERRIPTRKLTIAMSEIHHLSIEEAIAFRRRKLIKAKFRIGESIEEQVTGGGSETYLQKEYQL